MFHSLAQPCVKQFVKTLFLLTCMSSAVVRTAPEEESGSSVVLISSHFALTVVGLSKIVESKNVSLFSSPAKHDRFEIDVSNTSFNGRR